MSINCFHIDIIAILKRRITELSIISLNIELYPSFAYFAMKIKYLLATLYIETYGSKINTLFLAK